MYEPSRYQKQQSVYHPITISVHDLIKHIISLREHHHSFLVTHQNMGGNINSLNDHIWCHKKFLLKHHLKHLGPPRTVEIHGESWTPRSYLWPSVIPRRRGTAVSGVRWSRRPYVKVSSALAKVETTRGDFYTVLIHGAWENMGKCMNIHYKWRFIDGDIISKWWIFH